MHSLMDANRGSTMELVPSPKLVLDLKACTTTAQLVSPFLRSFNPGWLHCSGLRQSRLHSVGMCESIGVGLLDTLHILLKIFMGLEKWF